jgi:hypothetical protein
MQANKHQICAHHLIKIVFSANRQGNVFDHIFLENFLKIKKIRRIKGIFFVIILIRHRE